MSEPDIEEPETTGERLIALFIMALGVATIVGLAWGAWV